MEKATAIPNDAKAEEIIVRMSNIDKVFSYVKAVDQGRFELRRGEIHALIGENGAGKSTMMKILYGLYERDDGTIELYGQPVGRHNTSQAIHAGIGMVHQEFMLVNEFTVLENVILGSEPQNFGVLDIKKARQLVSQHAEEYHLDIQLNKLVKNISVGEMQRVEIIKALYRGAEILILDEPTAVLTPQEAEKLFVILKTMRDKGKSIVFISHKLDEVLAISDRITVMRHGKHVATLNARDTNKTELSCMMVGKNIALNTAYSKCTLGDQVLSVSDLFVLGERNLSTIKHLSFQVHGGEILGIAGIDGNGQSELVDAICGLRRIQNGTVKICGKDVTNHSPMQIRKAGSAHIPEDRNTRGLAKGFTVEDNLLATYGRAERVSTVFFRNARRITEMAKKMIQKYDIRPNNSKALAGQFSGGNAQKIVIAREVEMGKPLLIAAHPTRGVDIGAVEAIHTILNHAKENGCAILLISADLDEIMGLADRIIVLHEGKISGEMKRDAFDKYTLGRFMMGGAFDEA